MLPELCTFGCVICLLSGKEGPWSLVGCQNAADLPIAGCPWAITRTQGR